MSAPITPCYCYGRGKVREFMGGFDMGWVACGCEAGRAWQAKQDAAAITLVAKP